MEIIVTLRWTEKVDYRHLHRETVSAVYYTWEFFRLLINFLECSMTPRKVNFQHLGRKTITAMCHTWESFQILSNVLGCSLTSKRRFSTSPPDRDGDVPHLGVLLSSVECSSVVWPHRNVDFRYLHRDLVLAPRDDHGNGLHLGVLNQIKFYFK